MAVPDTDILFASFNILLTQFSPNNLCFLDGRGDWQLDPKSLRDRISNEVLYRLWKTIQEGTAEREVRGFIIPFIQGEQEWEFSRTAYCRLSCSDKDAPPHLVILELLHYLVEYRAYQINSTSYVADWDIIGNAQRDSYAKKLQGFSSSIKKTCGEQIHSYMVNRMIDSLCAPENGVFSQVCHIIAEEEKVRQQLPMILNNARSVDTQNEVYSAISEQVIPSLRSLTHIPEALLRPSLDILLSPTVPIATGLQYEAATILSILSDQRSIDVLLRTLDVCPKKHVNVRCNLIYALGRLRADSAVLALIQVLQDPDTSDTTVNTNVSLCEQTAYWEKCEAIWALGKCALKAVAAIPTLAKLVQTPSHDIAIALAWAVTQIGEAQKERYGGIDARIMTTLMTLLNTDDQETFGEVTYDLKRLELPDFLHSLYLHDMNTLPILALKPSSTGLYELSETLYHLTSVKRPVIMAVTGDSGTGKTYFCQALANGFGPIRKDDILYLMRDAPAHMEIFDRMLGIRRLREYLDPPHYENYPLSEIDDKPDEYFEEFLANNSDKQLIILDGWMDKSFFYHVIDVFYEKKCLDVLVNFRTTVSTKRRNLEDREKVLETVKTCLTYVEEPTVEETEFYRNGDVLVYNLDNSSRSRLSAEEICEVFARQKVEQWGDYIRIGRFSDSVHPFEVTTACIPPQVEQVETRTETFRITPQCGFLPTEQHFRRILNEDTRFPHLLQTIELDDLFIYHVAFYSQGQLAFVGSKGDIGILSGLNDRIYCTHLHKSAVKDLCVLGADIVSYDDENSLKMTSLVENTTCEIEYNMPLVSALASDRSSIIATGHVDGTIRVWDMATHRVTVVRGHLSRITAIKVDHKSRIFSVDKEGLLKVFRPGKTELLTLELGERICPLLSLYPGGKVVCATASDAKGSTLHIIDIEAGRIQRISSREITKVITALAYFDGRMIVGVDLRHAAATIAVFELRYEPNGYVIVGQHGEEVRDCVTMGPRIITCGTEGSEHTLRIWGTSGYVLSERGKLRLMSSTMTKPGYYRTIF